MNDQLAKRVEDQPMAIVPMSAAEAAQAMVKAGVTADSAIAIEKLMGLARQEREDAARQSFTLAFARVRAQTGRINATRANPDKNGNVRWWMADLVDLQDAIEPICRSEGLELSFDSRRDGATLQIVTGICIVMHVASGHVERRECGINAGNAQGGDLGAMTTAKRGALIAMFGLRIRHDDNARMLGDLISLEQGAELRRRLAAVRPGGERKFLAYALGCNEADIVAGQDRSNPYADWWKQIRQGKLEKLHDALHTAEMAATKNTGAGVKGDAHAAVVGEPHATPTKAAPSGGAGNPLAGRASADEFVAKMTPGACLSWILQQRTRHGGLVDEAMIDAGVNSLGDATEPQIRALAIKLKSQIS